ncbi:MAG TPA: GNAT family N-acetyltransferase [Sphingomicrobium sp.]|nr:GNAT family N-acetyltransferase [Sphingomicrobium sp.]
MSDERVGALAESARNRGLRLVRSRVRTPGKRRFGKVGLTDRAGKAVFGMDDKGPAANPDEVEDYLRNLGASDWGASLDVAVLPRKRKPTKVARPRPEPANDSEPARKLARKAAPPPPKPRREPKPKPPPAPKLRQAKPEDYRILAKLINYLGHEIDQKTVRKNLTKLARMRETPMVAVEGKAVVGLIGIHKTVTVHRPAPVGRITILVVAEEAQDRGIGRMLVAAAEQALRKAGCRIVEVTSNDRRTAAHAFYRHLGYERTSLRFMKEL